MLCLCVCARSCTSDSECDAGSNTSALFGLLFLLCSAARACFPTPYLYNSSPFIANKCVNMCVCVCAIFFFLEAFVPVLRVAVLSIFVCLFEGLNRHLFDGLLWLCTGGEGGGV